MSPADYSPSVADGGWTREQLADLRRKIVEHFNDEELRTLCFDIGADYESLPAQGKEGKARELIALELRLGQLDGLLAACRAARPNGDWELDAPIQHQPPRPEPGPAPVGFQPIGRWQMQVSDGSAWLLTFLPNGSFVGQGIGAWWGTGAQASGGWTFFIPVQTLQLQGLVNNMLPITTVLVIQGQQGDSYYALSNDGKTCVFTRA